MSNLEKTPLSEKALSEIIARTISGKRMYSDATFLIESGVDKARGENFKILITNQAELGELALAELEQDLAHILSQNALA